MVDNVKRISVIGGPGTGKSTLTKNLGRELKLPVHHIDGINHLKNWEKRDKEERDKMILDITRDKEWIIDGTYNKTLDERLKRSDVVVFLDYSTPAKLKGILSRYIKGRGKEKEEIPGCKEKMDWEFFSYTMRWNKDRRHDVKNIVDRYNDFKDKKIYIFKNRKNLNKWYEEKFGKKIEL